MAPPLADTSIPTGPDHDVLVKAIAADAARDAHRVADLLDSLKIRATPQVPMQWNGDFLLELGAAMRLREWEIMTPLVEADSLQGFQRMGLTAKGR
jgi:hypothetical protein